MGNKSILLVDPDETLGTLVAEILSEEGYRITMVHTMPEAVALLAESQFDLVITEAFDQPMRFDFDPSFLATLFSESGKTPVALFSTYSSTDAIRPGDYGLADLLPKPFDIEDLVKRVARIISDNGPKLNGARNRAVA